MGLIWIKEEMTELRLKNHDFSDYFGLRGNKR